MASRSTIVTLAALALLMATAACARFPQLADDAERATQTAAFPKILPIDALIASVPAGGPDLPQDRAPSLDLNAQSMSGQGLTDADRQRLHDATANP